jgi:ribosomal protein S18 acetylase RimI-like enzyme
MWCSGGNRRFPREWGGRPAWPDGPVIRRGGPNDVPFLRDMLHHAYYWRENAPEMGDLPVSRYVSGWGRPGDAAVIAIEEHFPVGAAWYRLFSRAEPGYGFVDEETPELSIAVVPNRRGKGHGNRLLEALMKRARADGYKALSLSVEPDNPALPIYERFGFRKVGENGGAWTMKADLT